MLTVTYREPDGDGGTELNTYCAQITKVHVEADKYSIKLQEKGEWNTEVHNFEPYHTEWENGWQTIK